ncbi:MAG: hypothetical protein OXQ92_12335, partial [Boseongicola sp.]|nr:hypothetical protein [Boseongicola sp.]
MDGNDLYTFEAIQTLTGAAGATFVVASGIQRAFGFNPRWLALAVAMVISFAVVIHAKGAGSDYFFAIINGFLIYLSAVGANTVVGTDNGTGVQARSGGLESVRQSR